MEIQELCGLVTFLSCLTNIKGEYICHSLAGPHFVLEHVDVGLLRPVFSDMGSSHTEACHHGLKPIPEENSHLIQIEIRLFGQVIAVGFYYQQGHGSLLTCLSLGA